MGAFIDQLKAKYEVGPAGVTDGNFRSVLWHDPVEGEWRDYVESDADDVMSGKDIFRGSLFNNKPRELSKNEAETKEYYQKNFSVGVVGLSGAAHAPAASKSDLYSSGQCDYTEKTHFARARRCYAKWQKLTGDAQRTLLAHNLGLNPEEPQAFRIAMREHFGDSAAVAYWFFEADSLNAAFKDSKLRDIFKAFAETELSNAQAEWNNA
jgi:hypothetical protein